MIVIGFTGTRKGMTVKQADVLREIIEQYKLAHSYLKGSKQVHFHHGDCIGADEEANVIAKSFDTYIAIHPPVSNHQRAFCKGDYEAQIKPNIERNHDIVDLCDILIACPKGNTEERRSGTWATIRYARKKGREVKIIYPDGEVGK